MYTDTVWDNFVEFCTPDGIMVTSVESEKNQYCVGKTIVEIGAIRGCDPIDAMMDLLLEEDNKVEMCIRDRSIHLVTAYISFAPVRVLRTGAFCFFQLFSEKRTQEPSPERVRSESCLLYTSRCV